MPSTPLPCSGWLVPFVPFITPWVVPIGVSVPSGFTVYSPGFSFIVLTPFGIGVPSGDICENTSSTFPIITPFGAIISPFGWILTWVTPCSPVI